MNPGLQCDNVTLIRPDALGGQRTVLERVSAEFPAAAITLVTGAMGSGKSSLLGILAGLLRPTEGRVLARGQAISRWTSPHRDRWRTRVGIIFQHLCLQGDLTVLENVMLPLIPRHLSLDQLRRRSRRSLEDLEIGHLAAQPPGILSGGERQRVAIARALTVRPDFVLADEPTAHQDTAGLHLVLAAIQRAAARGATAIVVAHDPRVLTAAVAQRHYHLHNACLTPIP